MALGGDFDSDKAGNVVFEVTISFFFPSQFLTLVCLDSVPRGCTTRRPARVRLRLVADLLPARCGFST